MNFSAEKFLNDITDHVEYYRANPDTAFNIAEIMSDHILVTAQATRAEEIYVKGGTSADGTAINLWGDDNTLSLYGCSFTKVTGNGRGGAIYVVANNTITVTIEKCIFSGNSTSGANGGALFIGAPCTIENCSFTDNRSTNNSGGALYIAGNGSVIRDCIFSGNYANSLDYKGGGALFLSAKCTVEDCTFSGNSAFTGANGGSGG